MLLTRAIFFRPRYNVVHYDNRGRPRDIQLVVISRPREG